MTDPAVRCIALVGLLGCLACRATAQGTGDESCVYSDWSEPAPIPHLADYQVLQFASVAVGPTDGYIVANEVPNLRAEPYAPGPLVAATLSGETIGRPPGAFVFGHPRAVVDREGTLHVVWGEPAHLDSLIGATWTGPWVRQLWYSTYTPQRGWTNPREVYRPSGPLYWSGQFPSVTVDSRGWVHIAVTHYAEQSVAHVLVREANQSVSRISTIRAPFHTGLAIDGSEVHLAVMGFDERGTPEGGANVYLMRSDDAGAHWSEPRVVPGSIDGNAGEVQVVVTQDNTLHVVWAHSPSNRLRPEVIRHVMTTDGGRTWSSVDETDVPDPFSGPRAVAGRCGGIHVAYDAWPGGLTQGQYGYGRWREAWEGPVHLFPHLRPVYVEMTSGPDGTLYLFAPARRAAEAPRAPLSALLSVASPFPVGQP